MGQHTFGIESVAAVTTVLLEMLRHSVFRAGLNVIVSVCLLRYQHVSNDRCRRENNTLSLTKYKTKMLAVVTCDHFKFPSRSYLGHRVGKA